MVEEVEEGRTGCRVRGEVVAEVGRLYGPECAATLVAVKLS